MVSLIATSAVMAAEEYLSAESFLEQSFDGEVPSVQRLWLTKELNAVIHDILGHDLGALRVRYWQLGERTAWILEEIGKEQPITTGFVVDGGALRDVRILVYRESRGWEVRYPSFTDQFKGVSLQPDRLLDRHIDGITGATMSVDALTRLARLALYFHARAVAESPR
jgi:hypothetical protein